MSAPSPQCVGVPFAILQGIETDSPVLQIGSLVFRGEYDNVAGTSLIFGRPQNGSEREREREREEVREGEMHVCMSIMLATL